jgi:hypothetical protein
VEDFDDANPPWLWTEFRGHSNPDTVAPIFRRYHAWVTPDRIRFDLIKTCSHITPGRSEFDKAPQRDEEPCDRLRRYFHNEVPKGERAWLEMVGKSAPLTAFRQWRPATFLDRYGTSASAQNGAPERKHRVTAGGSSWPRPNGISLPSSPWASTRVARTFLR